MLWQVGTEGNAARPGDDKARGSFSEAVRIVDAGFVADGKGDSHLTEAIAEILAHLGERFLRLVIRAGDSDALVRDDLSTAVAVQSTWARPDAHLTDRGSTVRTASYLTATLLTLALSSGPLAPHSRAEDKPKPVTRLGIDRTHFTVNDKSTFLFGVSYYGALGASDETVRRDLADLKKHGFNWIRVWATWASFGEDVSAVDAEGKAREAGLKKLERFVALCDEQGIVVDLTLSRGNGTTGPARLQTLEAHRQAVQTLVTALKARRNWYLDLANERNIRDKRFTSIADLKELRELVRTLDPRRLVTASHAGDLSRADLGEYLTTVRVDFLSPHRPRTAQSPGQTEAKSKEYRAWMKELGRETPLHYQEPFRRDFGGWQPRAEDFVTDLQGALAGGAAGWCWHNGDNRAAKDGRPRRSFDLRAQRLFEQLDAEEAKALPLLAKVIAEAGPVQR
jgi:hypothetical protein